MSSTHRKLRLSAKILAVDTPIEFSYIYYLSKGTIYYIMLNSTLRYVKCTRLGRPCVNLS